MKKYRIVRVDPYTLQKESQGEVYDERGILELKARLLARGSFEDAMNTAVEELQWVPSNIWQAR